MDPYLPIYMLAILLAFVITLISEKILIPKLARLGGQPIYTEGPEWHKSKKGTPTMGGIAFLISAGLTVIPGGILMIYNGHKDDGIALLIGAVYCVLNGAVGIFDDLKKLKRKKNLGLKPYQKLLLQFAITATMLVARFLLIEDHGTSVLGIDLKALYYPLSAIIAVGIINFVNLTDGIDGLCSGVAFTVAITMLISSYSVCYSSALLCASTVGITMGFLVFNSHPARVFMGDTGSLFLGAVAVSTVIADAQSLKNLPLLGVYIIEGLSVIIQVVCYKLTHKRVFKMAPFHHHLEKCGWSENRICIVAIMLTMLLSLPVYAFYLL